MQDCATSAAPASSLRSSSSAASAAALPYAQSTNGEVDAAGFVGLMEEVVARTKGGFKRFMRQATVLPWVVAPLAWVAARSQD